MLWWDSQCVIKITFDLVGTTGRWNDAKLAELRDRVQHTGGIPEI